MLDNVLHHDPGRSPVTRTLLYKARNRHYTDAAATSGRTCLARRDKYTKFGRGPCTLMVQLYDKPSHR